LGSEGKVLVRASGTEPLIRIQVQAQTMEKVDAIIEDIKTKLTSLASKQ
jgi:phosphoglucosamine mutase